MLHDDSYIHRFIQRKSNDLSKKTRPYLSLGISLEKHSRGKNKILCQKENKNSCELNRQKDSKIRRKLNKQLIKITKHFQVFKATQKPNHSQTLFQGISMTFIYDFLKRMQSKQRIYYFSLGLLVTTLVRRRGAWTRGTLVSYQY